VSSELNSPVNPQVEWMPFVSRRLFLRLVATAPFAGFLGCKTTPCIFGYKLGAGALYDENIASVYVPVFHNRAFQTTPYRGLEVDITQAVIREIGRTTNFKVVSDPSRADTELLGAVVQIQKQIMNRNQQNMVRDGDLIVDVDVVWRDLRTNEILSMPKKSRPIVAGPFALPGDAPPTPFDPSVPLPPPPGCEPQVPYPTRITGIGRYVPELGETNSSASKRVQDQIAVQIVSMMEKKW
jgi:hypothetical protein